MAKQRQLFRVAIERSGMVRHGGEAFSCSIVDLTEKGVRLRINGSFEVGEELQLQFAIAEGHTLEGIVQVTHREPPYLGAEIIRMPPDDQRRLSNFIEELNALNMSGI
jgi:PilZ domain-containing protein